MLAGLEKKRIVLHDGEVVDEDYEPNTNRFFVVVLFRDYDIMEDHSCLRMDLGSYCIDDPFIMLEGTDDDPASPKFGYHWAQFAGGILRYTTKQRLLKKRRAREPDPNYDAMVELSRRIRREVKKDPDRAAKRIAAGERAEKLLRDNLSEEEYRRYLRKKSILVRGNSGRNYVIPKHGKITVLGQDFKKLATLCIHSDTSVPDADHLVAMKLLVENDESAVWSGANINLATT